MVFTNVAPTDDPNEEEYAGFEKTLLEDFAPNLDQTTTFQAT